MQNNKGNPIQQEAIRFGAGVMQVLAGPGSGKTFTTIERIAYLIDGHHVDPSRILVITFTKAAALEMQERFHRKFSESGKSRPPVTFGTFHAVFYHILRESGQYRHYSLITESEKRKLLLQILKLPPSAALSGNEKVELLLADISRLKNNGENFEAIKEDIFPKEEVQAIYKEYNSFLSEFAKLDFDDMGLLCLRLLRENTALLKRWQETFRYILVDEFQDINPLQYDIVKLLAAPENNLFVVGDDDQSIYGFRGAEPKIMRQFMDDFPGARQLLLNVNYRSHEKVVEDACKVIACNEDRFPKEISASHADGKGVALHAFPDEDTEYETLLAAWQETYKKEGESALSNIAVLFRTNQECSRLAERLLSVGLPFVMKEPVKSRFEHFAIEDMLAYLEFAAGNKHRSIFHLFMNRPVRYLKKESARSEMIYEEELLAYYRNDLRMQKAVRTLFLQLNRIGTMRPHLAISYIRRAVGYDAWVKTHYAPEESEKILQILEEFQAFAKGFYSARDLIDYIGQSKEQTKEQNKQQKEGKKQDGIRLMTMHASKGLEFPIVYLPDLNEGKIPDRQAKAKQDLEEERRMLYVAMTRAKNELHLIYCQDESGHERPSRFLEPLLAE